MTDEEALETFDRLAARDYNIHDYNRWGASYFQQRDRYRDNPRAYDPARLAASDRRIIDALGDDPEVLFEFATSVNGYYYGGATLHDEGYGNLREDLIGKYGPDAPTTHLNMFREEYHR